MNFTEQYVGKQAVQFERRNGKYVLEFDDIPSLLFVSYEGTGRTDQTFYDGELIRNAKAVSIYSEVDSATEFELKAYAIAMK